MTSVKTFTKYKPLKNDYSESTSEKTSLLQSGNVTQNSIFAFSKSNLNTYESNDDNLSMLRSRGSNTKLSNGVQDVKPLEDDYVHVMKDVLPGESLQTISLLYGCSISEIKRLNGFITDQDFYAVKSVKIPMKKHGLLTESTEFNSRAMTTSLTGVSHALPTRLEEQNNDILKPLKFTSHESDHNILVDLGEGSSAKKLSPVIDSGGSSESLNLLQGEKNIAKDRNDTSSYLKNLDKDIRKTVRKADIKSTNTEVLDELHLHLPSSINYHQPLPHKRKSVDGADCGIKWWSVLLCFVFVLLFFSILAVYEYQHTEIDSINESTVKP